MALKVLITAIIVGVLTTQSYSANEQPRKFDIKAEEKKALDLIVSSANHLQQLVTEVGNKLFGNETEKQLKELGPRNNAAIANFGLLLNQMKENLESLAKNMTSAVAV